MDDTLRDETLIKYKFSLSDRQHASYRTILRWLKTLFTPLAILALLSAGWIHRDTVTQIFISAEILPLLFSLGLWITLHSISPFFTVAVFRNIGHPISYLQAFLIHNIRLPAKYIPGGIWHTAARATDYHKLGIASQDLGIYLVLENFIQLIVTFSMGSVIVLSFVETTELKAILITILIGSLITLISVPFILRYFKQKTQRSISLSGYILAVAISSFYWIIASTSFVVFLSAFPELRFELSYIEVSGAYMLSWAVGYIAIFAPQGIGVSEFIFTSILPGNMHVAGLIAFIATFRVLVLIGDMCACLVAYLYKKPL